MVVKNRNRRRARKKREGQWSNESDSGPQASIQA